MKTRKIPHVNRSERHLSYGDNASHLDNSNVHTKPGAEDFIERTWVCLALQSVLGLMAGTRKSWDLYFRWVGFLHGRSHVAVMMKSGETPSAAEG